MQWESWSAFWAMGGRAPFVWGSYGVMLALVALEVWWLRCQWRQTLAAVAEGHEAQGDDAALVVRQDGETVR